MRTPSHSHEPGTPRRSLWLTVALEIRKAVADHRAGKPIAFTAPRLKDRVAVKERGGDRTP